MGKYFLKKACMIGNMWTSQEIKEILKKRDLEEQERSKKRDLQEREMLRKLDLQEQAMLAARDAQAGLE